MLTDEALHATIRAVDRMTDDADSEAYAGICRAGHQIWTTMKHIGAPAWPRPAGPAGATGAVGQCCGAPTGEDQCGT
jgi:hypothetical protein